MKKKVSAELKIMIAAMVVMLTLFTAVVVAQIFKNNSQNVTFVYNSASTEAATEVNISDIFSII